VKNKKVKISPRYFVFKILKTAEGKIVMIKRTEKDIWQNLFQFPLFEFTSQEKNRDFWN
jgi:A/G-specific DNA glycosylase